MTSTETLICDLSAELAPVTRRSLRRDLCLLLALGGAELALALAAGWVRPDLGQVLLEPFMLWKIGGLSLLAGLSALVAMRSFAPTSSRNGLKRIVVAAGLVTAIGSAVTSAADSDRPLLARLAPMHGMLCAGAIVMLAVPMLLLLAVLMRRAAPAHPKRGAAAAGLAASTLGALVFAIRCPMNDPLYIVTWYAAAITAVTVASRWLLPRRFRL